MKLARLVTVALTIAAVLVAGILVRTAKGVEDRDRQLFVTAELGVPVELDHGAQVRITGVETGSSVILDSERIAPIGRWVMVTFEISAGERLVRGLDPQLRAGPGLHDPLNSSEESAPPGFTSIRYALFDVPVDRLDDLTFEIGPREIIFSHQHWVRWRPELTAQQISDDELTVLTPVRSTLVVTR